MTIDTPNADTAMNPSGDVSQPQWWIDDNLPGAGTKPDWLSSKFKTVADLAKSYHELEKRVGSAPDRYDFSKSKFLDSEYHGFKELQDLAKTRRVPSDVIDKMIESVDSYFSQFTPDESKEMEKLGPQAKERLETLNNWARANLSEDSYNALSKSLQDANSIKALEELRNKMLNSTTSIPTANGASNTEMPTMKEMQDELNNNLEKYKNDEKYRNDYQARLARVVEKDSMFVDKHK